MSDNNSCVITIKSPETIVRQGEIIAIMPSKMEPPQGNVRKAIIELPLVLKKEK